MALPVLWRRRTVHWFFKVLFAAVSVGANTYLVLTAKKAVPNHQNGNLAAISWDGLVALFTSLRSALLGTFVEQSNAKSESVREALVNAMFTAAQLTNVDVRKINAVFLVRRRDLLGRQFLDPTVRAELGAHEPSSVTWTKGKGAVGLCWENEQAEFHDQRPIYRKHQKSDAAQWNTARGDTRMGLSFEDWRRTRGKYGTIVAACTHGRKGITGVIAMNAPLDVDWTAFEKDLKVLMIATAKHVDHVLQ